MLMHTDAFKAQQKKGGGGLSCIHTHTQTAESFVIQQQPVVIDWSICLCVAYKWATWYSALFIWNQLRQRCCVSACSMRALFLSRPLVLCLRQRDSGQEETRWRGGSREGDAGRKRAVSVRSLCLTAFAGS